MKTLRTRLLTLPCGIALLMASPAVLAQADASCLERWNKAIALAHIAEKCKLGDAATAARIKQAEEANLQCATQKSSAAEKAEVAESAAATKSKVKAQLAAMPCGDDAKKYFDAQVQGLK